MKKYLVETVCTYRMRYVVEAENEFIAEAVVIEGLQTNDIKEFSQKHIDEETFSIRTIKNKEFLKLFDLDNSYLKSWTDEQKYDFINRPDEKQIEIEW